MTGTEPYTGQGGLRSGGTYISTIFGTRVATPFFGAGFNVCIGAPAAGRLLAPLKLTVHVCRQHVAGTSPVVLPTRLHSSTAFRKCIKPTCPSCPRCSLREALPDAGRAHNAPCAWKRVGAIAAPLRLWPVCTADSYFGSFPKVGVVVPSPAAWLLPEFQDLSSQLTTTLDLPEVVGSGVSAEPTGDGFLIWLPSSAFAPVASPHHNSFTAACLPVMPSALGEVLV